MGKGFNIGNILLENTYPFPLHRGKKQIAFLHILFHSLVQTLKKLVLFYRLQQIMNCLLYTSIISEYGIPFLSLKRYTVWYSGPSLRLKSRILMATQRLSRE